MASPVVGVVLMVGITFVSFGSLVVFATTNHYEKESCKNAGAFQSIYDTKECPSVRRGGNETTTEEGKPPMVDDYVGCTELLYEGSNIWLCPVAMT